VEPKQSLDQTVADAIYQTQETRPGLAMYILKGFKVNP